MSIILQTALIYTLVFIIMLTCAREYASSKANKVLRLICLSTLLFSFSLVFGIRYDVGVDFIYYLKTYTHFQNKVSLYEYFEEPFWNILGLSLTHLNAHYTIFFSLIAFLQIFFLSIPFIKEKRFLPCFVIVLFCGGYFLTIQNTMRQCLAAAIFLGIIVYKPNLNLIKFVILVLLLTTIHKSALILFIFYPLIHLSKSLYFRPKLKIILYIGAVFFGLFFSSTFNSIVNSSLFLSIVETTDYIKYSKSFDLGMERSLGIGYIIKIITNIIVILFEDNIVRYFNNTIIRKWFHIYFCGIILAALFPNSMLLGRMTLYFTIFGLVIFTYFIYYIFHAKFKSYSSTKYLGYATIAGMMLLTINTLYANPRNMHSYYHFWWEAPYTGYSFYSKTNHK